ncbi:hypothetical protein [Pseudoxanthomonas mexicana]|nr:hypothetical protein [Pseudoxanthomonas mexicana]
MDRLKLALIFLLAISVAPLAACKTLASTYYEGAYYWDVEEEALVLCGSDRVYWLEGRNGVLQPAREMVEKLRRESGKQEVPLFVRVMAVDKGPAEDGFAMDYDAVLEVASIEVVSADLPATCAVRPPHGAPR